MRSVLRTRKLLVEVLMPNADIIRVKRKTEGDQVVIEDSSRGKTGWKPKFDKDSIVNERRGRLIKSYRPKVIVSYGADECFTLPLGKMPVPNPDTIKRLFDAQVLQNAGRSILKVNVPIAVYLLLMVILILTVLQFLSGRGITIVR